jgi:hypothetical protein
VELAIGTGVQESPYALQILHVSVVSALTKGHSILCDSEAKGPTLKTRAWGTLKTNLRVWATRHPEKQP